jgi:hypothetical protein
MITIVAVEGDIIMSRTLFIREEELREMPIAQLFNLSRVVLDALGYQLGQMHQQLEKVRSSRGGRMALEGKTFIAIQDDESYYMDVYATLRSHAQDSGDWSAEDERIFIEQADKLDWSPQDGNDE